MNTPFLITNWCGIPEAFVRHADGTLAKERIREMADAGLTLLGLDDCGVQTNREMLAACLDCGVRAMLFEHRATAAVFDAQNRQALLKSLVDDYRDCPALHSYHIIDEPSNKQFASIMDVIETLKRLDPERESYVNLFPNYASTAQLGNESYPEHLEEYLSTVRPPLLSFDHYHLIREHAATDLTLEDERQNAILHDAYRQVDRPGFFDNLEDVRAASVRYGIPFMLIVLLTEHGPYRNLTESEIRYEVFQALAYGSVRISYFTYWTLPYDEIWHWKNGMISADGRRTPHYFDVQRINRDLQPIGQALGGRAPTVLFHIGKEPDGKVAYWPGAYGPLTGIDARCLTVSFFEEGLLLLASKDYTADQPLTLSLADRVSVARFDPATEEWHALSPHDGKVALMLSPGDAALLRTL